MHLRVVIPLFEIRTIWIDRKKAIKPSSIERIHVIITLQRERPIMMCNPFHNNHRKSNH